jgi:carboxymethylenebutenolidase
MQKNLPILILVVVVLIVGFVVFNKKEKTAEIMETTNTNGQMLATENGVAISTESDLAYFENAKGYFARPEAEGNYPGIVMIHENRGLRPEIKTMADELAREGYMVLAVDLFEGKVVETQPEARELTASFDNAKGVENMRAAAKYLRDKGATKMASLGWCFGGRQSVALAISGEPLDATVVYYGGNMATTTDKLAPISWPVLGIFGDQDQAIPVETVRMFEASLNTLGVENEIHIYPGVGHAFANPSGANYAPNETKDAWAKTVSFLNEHLR